MDSIDVRKLGVDVSKFSWTESPKTFGLDAEPPFQHPVTLQIGARLAGGRVLVAGTAVTRLRLECSRCLDSFEAGLTADVAVEFREGAAPVRKVDEIDDESGDVSWFEPPFIHL